MFISRDQLTDAFSASESLGLPLKNFIVPGTAQFPGSMVYNSTDENLYYSNGEQWVKLAQETLTGDVSGPANATDEAIARFDGTTGKLIQNSSATLSDTGILSTNVVNFPLTTLTAGQITVNGTRWLHGYNGGGTSNIFLGFNAGNFTVTNSNNIGIGAYALENISSSSNVAIGSFSGRNADGDFNVFVGYESGTGYLGDRNVGLGPGTLKEGTGDDNVFIGYRTGINHLGNRNTAIGSNALDPGVGPSTGDDNIYIGFNSGENQLGNRNVALGWRTLDSGTCTNNVALGYSAATNPTAASNSIFILNTGSVADTNTIKIGTQGTQLSCTISGIHGRTSAAGIPVYINATGVLGTTTSSIRFKEEIETISAEQSSFVNQLRPVAFRYKETPDIQSYGLIAEEVLPLKSELVLLEEDGETPFTVKYDYIVPFLISQLQEANRNIEELKSDAAILSNQVLSLINRINTLEQA